MLIHVPLVGGGGAHCLGGGGGLIHVPLEGGGGAPYFGGQRQFLLGSQTVKISFLSPTLLATLPPL